MSTPTPHIAAAPGDFADVVLMPGDPLRARYIAENHLDDAQQVTTIRNMEGYTGTYQGVPVSTMGSGMGIPSISIYATELARFYGVTRIIRVGSCGAMADEVNLRDIIIASGAGTDSLVNRMRLRGYDFPAVADFGLLRAAADAAEARGLPAKVGPIFSSDLFYHPDTELFAALAAHGILGVEMEAAGLYGVAAEEGIRALTIATVSDHIAKQEALTADERQAGLDEMILLALDTAAATTAPA